MSSDHEALAESSTWGPGTRLPEEDSVIGPLDGDDSLTRLLSTAAMAAKFDRSLTQRCVRRAAILLGLDSSAEREAPEIRLPSRSGLAFWQVKRVKTYVEDNLGSTIRAARLAELSGLSTSHFHHAFRRTFGVSPIAYVMKQRVRRAQGHMLKSGASLSQIALECGMCDQAHFSRVFRRIVGISPAAWRRQHEYLAPDNNVAKHQNQLNQVLSCAAQGYSRD